MWVNTFIQFSNEIMDVPCPYHLMQFILSINTFYLFCTKCTVCFMDREGSAMCNKLLPLTFLSFGMSVFYKEHLAGQSVCTVSTDPTEQTRTTVASVSESVCRPLRTRIEQMIVTDQRREGGKKPVMLYKISNLLRFYHNTILQVSVHIHSIIVYQFYFSFTLQDIFDAILWLYEALLKYHSYVCP